MSFICMQKVFFNFFTRLLTMVLNLKLFSFHPKITFRFAELLNLDVSINQQQNKNDTFETLNSEIL